MVSANKRTVPVPGIVFENSRAFVLAYRRSAGDVRYNMENFLELRRNHAAYAVFYSTYLPAIVGKQSFKKRVTNLEKDKEIATVSDEALALLGLENGEERWADVYTKSDGEIRPVRKDEEYPEEWISTVPTKYTIPTKTDPNNDKEGNDKRWSTGGIIRFNQLHQQVVKDRAEHPGFLAKWLAAERENSGSDSAIADSAVDNPNMVDAIDDFDATPSKMPARAHTKAAGTAGVAEEDDDDDTSRDSEFGAE
jgi:hypothetical protein